MVGIDVDRLESLILRNNYYAYFLSSNIKNMVNETNKFSLYCGGEIVDYLYQKPMEQCEDFEKIVDIIKDYSLVLKQVIENYKIKSHQISEEMNDKSQNIREVI